MKKNLIALALILSAGAAHAGANIIDEFNINQGPLTQSAPGAAITDVLAGVRTLSMEQLSSDFGFGDSRARVINGVFLVSNESGVDSEVKVIWNVAPFSIPAGSSDLSFLFKVLASDGNPTTVDITLDGNSIFSQAIPGNTVNQDIEFSVSSSIGSGGVLEMTLNGVPGWDLTIDAFGVSWKDPTTTTVPEPASIALVGLGMMGMMALRRRR